MNEVRDVMLHFETHYPNSSYHRTGRGVPLRLLSVLWQSLTRCLLVDLRSTANHLNLCIDQCGEAYRNA
jgi:hypothetical protein